MKLSVIRRPQEAGILEPGLYVALWSRSLKAENKEDLVYRWSSLLT